MRSFIVNVEGIGGLVLLFTGLWWERPSVAMVVLGSIFLWASIASIPFGHSRDEEDQTE